MMNTPRPRMNLQGNAFNQQQQNSFNQQQQNQQGVGGGSAKSRKKRKKKMQQQARQQQMMMQHQQQMQQFQWNQNPQNQNQHETPPLPDAPPPPLPPGSPPPPPPPPAKVTEANEPSNISLPPVAPPPDLPAFKGPVPVLPSAAQVQNQGVKALDEWPAPLRDYVGRCYAKCVTQIDQDRVGVILKGKLMRATNDGTLWTKDWASEPLPLLDSDTKAVMNLKEKLSRQSITSRLGPRTASPTVPHRKRSSLPTRGSGRSTYRSDSSSSRSSRSSSSSKRSRSRSPRSSKKPARTPNKKSRGNHNNNRRNNNYSNSHFYSEFGIIGGSEDLNVKKEVLDKRAARFNATGATKQPTLSSAIGNRLGSMSKDSSGPPRKKHNPLFVYDNGPSNNSGNGPANCGDYEVSDLHIIGTCEDLEKGYLRLTSAPEASQVRPKSVLLKSLEMVKAKWVKDRDYHYTFEQLKSIRQDLTVQGIRDALSVNVYETHARIALEMKDHAEFNQCQSQLRILHEEVKEAAENKIEFKAYGILYFIFTKDFMELSTRLCSLTKEDKEDECIRHAVDLARAWLVGNHVRIFKLYKSAPKMSSYLIDLFVDRERLAYFKVIMKAYVYKEWFKPIT
uniref:Leukocyte receptor cluster member 8 n=1 Tax=Lygus hesperus TaxID=30085 RepID=A0A146KJ97_LYGHE